MKIPELIAIAVGLSMDALAIAIAGGYAVKRLHLNYALRIAACFGLAQMLMPLLGWLGGIRLRDLVATFDHWLVFGVLSFIGVKMIYESITLKKAERPDVQMSLRLLVVMAVATSIDALAVGFSISLLGTGIITAALVIGVITFAISLAGVYIGNRFGHCFENKIEIIGGLILIGIGIRVLWQG